MMNTWGGHSAVSWRDLRPFCVFCGLQGSPRRDADEALDVASELALVQKPGIRGHLRKRQFAVWSWGCLQQSGICLTPPPTTLSYQRSTAPRP